MRIVVTGAAGFIGSHIIGLLREAGNAVLGLDSLAPQVHRGLSADLPPDPGLIVGDIRDPERSILIRMDG
jgi:dTDP-L-rhamnose 4-epimerase